MIWSFLRSPHQAKFLQELPSCRPWENLIYQTGTSWDLGTSYGFSLVFPWGLGLRKFFFSARWSSSRMLSWAIGVSGLAAGKSLQFANSLRTWTWPSGNSWFTHQKSMVDLSSSFNVAVHQTGYPMFRATQLFGRRWYRCWEFDEGLRTWLQQLCHTKDALFEMVFDNILIGGLETFLIFPFSWEQWSQLTNSIIFQRDRSTTNQIFLGAMDVVDTCGMIPPNNHPSW